MRPATRLAADVLLSFLGAALVLPVFATLLPGVPAHRILLRTALAAVLLLVWGRRAVYLGPTTREAGLERFPGATDDLAFGIAAAGGVLGAVILLMRADAALLPTEAAPTAGAIIGALAAAAVVGPLEEILFRGAAFRVWGAAGSSALYALVHFLRPGVRRATAGLDPWIGLRTLGDLAAALLDPAILPGLLGLFLFGLVLCLARARTRSLYLPIGLHAGGVFMLRLVGPFTEPALDVRPFLWGTAYPRPLSGLAGMAALGLLAVLVDLYARRRRP